MSDAGGDTSMLFTALGVIALGIAMMTFFVPLVTRAVRERQARSPEIKSPLDGLILSPIYAWIVRFLGLIAFLGGAAVLWIVLTGHLPFGLGDQ
ncbi:MAG TPA: hypothetical protein VNU97_09190 [Rhizomicrobium sp.]|jgi:hypothetical protein|nr:hypothetical protein [Rhizomicrobium sp.]